MSEILDNPYCTVQDVQREIRNSKPEVVDKLIDVINLASRQIDEYCQRDFLYHNWSASPAGVSYKWVSRDCLYMPWPVLSGNPGTDAGLDPYSGARAIVKIVEMGTDADPSYYNVKQDTSGRIDRQFPFAGVEWLAAMGAGDYGSGGDDFREYDALNWRGLYNWQLLARRGQLLIQGTFGYMPDASNPGQAPPIGLPAGVRRACTLIAAAWSGEYRRQWVTTDGQKTDVVDNRIPREAEVILQKWRRAVI